MQHTTLPVEFNISIAMVFFTLFDAIRNQYEISCVFKAVVLGPTHPCRAESFPKTLLSHSFSVCNHDIVSPLIIACCD